ncbi:sensor histidine kinase [Ruania zhangjianzhongii]|uniref:sensor histidine kinase n=1 Tax=Ruania zhangjianzhongii TaxID=2603206 RepID=UPI001F2242DB|nr:histidine kinase [Ruania zhangjianzhongii]
MRRFGSNEWAGLFMLVAAIAVGTPVLVGMVPPDIPRAGWSTLFALFLGVLLVAVVAERPQVRYTAFAVTVLISWSVVLTAMAMDMLWILLVLVAAVSASVVPVPVGLVVIAANTGVIIWIKTARGDGPSESVVVVAFYLVIQLASLLSSHAFIREQHTRRELTAAHVELRAASALLSESARTTERLRISRELHDLIGHQLTVLTLELEAARHRDGDQARNHVDRANQVARDLLRDVRETVGELRAAPSHLPAALREVVGDLPGLQATVEIDDDLRLDEERTAAFVRAAQEIATNTIRHSEARRLHIEVRADGTGTVLTAVDDGYGHPDPAPGHGLAGLAERFEALGGAITFDGSAGFRVTAQVPS